ncbi:MAG: hypothetical protein R3E01_04490 [Pirellulaceae bacterium]|nr:transglutaminase domain-containing protein [Planctomycetales bacterium]
MKKSLIGLATACCCLLSTAVSFAEYKTVCGWDDQLFPAYILATGTVKIDSDGIDPHLLGDPAGIVGIDIVAPAHNTKVTVTVTCPEFIEPSKYSGTLANGGEFYAVRPKIRYRYDRLGECRQATPATVTFSVQLGDEPVEEIVKTVTFRSVNDCPIRVVENGEVVDISFTFAAFANEQHPFVDKLLREALDLGVVDRFTGYQSGDLNDVFRQVYALWDLMVARDTRYSSITTTAADSSQILSQHVRLLEDTVNNGQANCVDGSVLFVSLLRKIGIKANLMLSPGHCYVTFWGDEEGTLVFGLETTLVDWTNDGATEISTDLDEVLTPDRRGVRSWDSFVNSITTATYTVAGDAEKFASPDEPEYLIIDVGQARTKGVLPIPYRGTEDFLGYDYSEYRQTQYGEYQEDEEEVPAE